MNTRIGSRLALFSLLVVVAGCGGTQRVTVIKLGHGLDPSHPVHAGMVYMAERLAEKSGGTMRIDIYPSEQLGTERQLLELLQIGSLGMTKVSAAVMENFAPSYQVFGIPYVFLNSDHEEVVLRGPIGRRILQEGEQYRLRGLAYYDAGKRSFYTVDRPVRQPDDLTGLKIRTQESPTAMRMVSTLGGSATPIAWGELYTSLQQGVVDGAENNPPSFYLSRHYEVARYYTINEHTAVPDVLIMSTIVWDALTPQQQQWVQEAADESVSVQKRLWKEASDAALQAVQDDGVEVIYPDKTLFADQVRSMHESYRDQPEIYALLEEIRAANPITTE